VTRAVSANVAGREVLCPFKEEAQAASFKDPARTAL